MALKQATRPLLQESRAFSSCQRIPRPSAVRCPFDFFPARRRVAHCSPARSAFIAGQRRAFSNTLRTRYAQVEDSIDPRDQPRESDQADVCIVGGGKPTNFVAYQIYLPSRIPQDRIDVSDTPH
jgi:hypothetical protein